MSYQVLARKWRPRNFKEMVGQEHVLRALINALDNDRLHHAYLFTGTRGVGKTTIARILAKCLNCETGITSEPCGKCSSCQEIASGSFVDLIEVDAASRTKVEDTRELLDNVQYAPTRGRFKVYLIDEVHMLTGHSFNALLKTLEEPPPHVKFLFATTDPQKLPVTVLSRCLQFNLKRMLVDMISGHLKTILNAEKIPFDDPSLRLIARGADGSMRDALSLLDQSIAFSNSELNEKDVREMLGTISHEPLLALLQEVSVGDGAAILKQIEDMSGVTPDFEAAADALISLLHELAVQQVVPSAHQDDESISQFAQEITKEEVQLFYQIALQGRRDIPLSPDPRAGFEMILLRMLSFRPLREGMQLEHSNANTESSDSSKKKTVRTEQKTESPQSVSKPHVEIAGKITEQSSQQVTSANVIKPEQNSDNEPPPWDVLPEVLTQPSLKKHTEIPPSSSPQTKVVELKEENKPEIVETSKADYQARALQKWFDVVPQLNLEGRAAELIKHCLLESQESGMISLTLDQASAGLLADSVRQQIEQALSHFYGKRIQLNLSVSEAPVSHSSEDETPAQRSARKIAERQQKAEQNIASDSFVIELQNRFGAQIVPGSIHPRSLSEN